ncbi:MAG: hypothetical protein ACR2IF_14365 [Terriglobales bacterium]
MRERSRWLVVVLFGTAMAWMESATVVYLRMLVGRVNPYQINPLPRHALLGNTELIRELATLLMLAAVGWLAGRNWRTRLAYAVIAFGVWDIFYYVFLAAIVGWPQSVLDWDVLFLIPLPWWGPVLAPVLIALLMMIGGTIVTQSSGLWPRRWTLALNAGGILLALAVFMAHSIRAANGGEAAVRAALPASFNWPLFAIALAMMSGVIFDLLSQMRRTSKRAYEQRAAAAN